MIKNLVISAITIIFVLILSSCNSCTPTPPPNQPKMEYKYSVIIDSIHQSKALSENTVAEILPYLSVCIEVVDTLEPNVFVLETKISSEVPAEINAISLVVDYDSSAVQFVDSVIINDVLYHMNVESNLPGITLFNNTGIDLRYSYVSTIGATITDEFIFRAIVKISASTIISYSEIPGELEFTNLDTQIYPLEISYLQFDKVQ